MSNLQRREDRNIQPRESREFPQNRISRPADAPAGVPAIFDVEECDSYYTVAVDLPTLSDKIEVFSENGELSVKSSEPDGHHPAVYFHCRYGRNMRVLYREGVLWLLLPKVLAVG